MFVLRRVLQGWEGGDCSEGSLRICFFFVVGFFFFFKKTTKQKNPEIVAQLYNFNYFLLGKYLTLCNSVEAKCKLAFYSS